ncbi:putative Thioredoxin domain-containing protein [Helianthus annuus]|nr:putative Thioredoxin domain-containing protein [Helianthus annuus]
MKLDDNLITRCAMLISTFSVCFVCVKVKEKDTAWFVKFCVPWCKHCKNLGSLWEELGKTMEGEDEIEVGEVDCGTNKPLCSKVKIGSYPSFKVFYNGEEVARYRGTVLTLIFA